MSSSIRTSLRAWSVLLATTGSFAAGCSSGTTNTDPGVIALSITPTSATIQQGASAPVAATLTRSGSFTGIVNLTVTGAPTGVTAVVSNVQTTGAVTTATVTINVDAATTPGAYPLVVHGNGTGVTEATANFALTVTALPSSYSLSLSAAALSIPQGGNAPTTTVTITRVNFTGAVTLGVTGLPANVTAAFVPAAPTTNTSVLTLTVGAAAALGNTNLVVTGTTTTAGNQNTPLTLTVAPAGNFSLTTTPASSVGVTQGTNVPVTVNIVRTGGNASDVALTAAGTLPTGLTLAFLPTSTTTNASVLTVTAAVGTAVGSYPIVIHGNTAGLAEQVVNLTINVVAPSGINIDVDVSACSVSDRPAWVALQDGSAAAPWTVVTPVANVYHFTIAQSTGGVAYVHLGNGTSTLNIYHLALSETGLYPHTFCPAIPPGITVNGTAANLATNFVGTINFGGATKTVLADGAFQITGAKSGVNDVVAYMKPAGGVGTADRGFINRGLNPGDNGSLGTVDFTGANSFAAISSGATVSGGVGGETLSQAMRYYTGTGANACTGASLYGGLQFTGSSFTVYGVPAANQVATDFHSIFLSVTNGTATSRQLQEDFQGLTARTASPFVLPSLLPTPTMATATAPYKRLDLSVTLAPEFNSSASVIQVDQTTPGRDIFLSLTPGYINGGTAAFLVPDFSALAGWNNAWAPAGADQIQWILTGVGTTLSACQDGHRFVASSRSGTN